MTFACFVLSTGRCGTQWLAEYLRRACGDSARVEHEPLGRDYAWRAMLGADDPHVLPHDLGEPILEHADSIERTMETRNYIECGHPSWSTIPWLVRRFAGRVRVIHLVRHPVPVALSWITQAAYLPQPLPHVPQKILVAPDDAGVAHPEYRETWQHLPPHEKVLYYWLEVNSIARRIDASTPLLRVRFEELFNDTTARSITDFLDSPPLPAGNLAQQVIDRFRGMSVLTWDPRRIALHPAVVSMARSLGYNPLPDAD